MRTVYARTESALPLSAGERVVGVVERPGMLSEYCIEPARPSQPTMGDCWRLLNGLSPLSALIGRKPTRLGMRRDRTHAGRERKRARRL
jgi:hypothetical protein